MPVFSDLSNDYLLIDYSPSHSQLLYRSKANKNRTYNIDIIFKGVVRIITPVLLKGLEIKATHALNVEQSMLAEKFDFITSQDYTIFHISDSYKKTYFLNAMCLGVYHNKLDILESSINRYDFGGIGEEVLWYNI